MNTTRRDILRFSGALLGLSSAYSLTGCTNSKWLAPSNTLTFDPNSPWHKVNEIVDSIKASIIPNNNFNIVDFGAVPGPSHNALLAIKKAILACKNSGGGTITIPKGFWRLDGPIHFINHMKLHLADGAHIQFSGNSEFYLPVVKTRWEGTEVYNFSPLIYANNCHDIAITGKGKIDGQGKKHFLPWRPKQKQDQRKLRDMGRDGVPVEQRIFGKGHKLRPQFIQFFNCQNVLVDGPTIIDSPFWCVHPVYCDQVIIRNITINSQHLNSDGVDPDSSSNVLIEHCSFNVQDDGVAIKAGRDQDGWRVGRKSERIVIRDCEYTGHAGGGMAIGSEMSGGVTDVYVENYNMPSCRHMLYFKANKDRGGEIQRIYIRNIRADFAEAVIIFTNDYHSYRGGSYPTVFKNVLIDNVVCNRSEIALHIAGNDSAPVENIILRNVVVKHADVPAQMHHVKNLIMDKVYINDKAYSAEMALAQTIKVKPKM